MSIGGNSARNNTGWGINAPGATDLGGNTARHNGNEPQCVGVVCRVAPAHLGPARSQAGGLDHDVR